MFVSFRGVSWGDDEKDSKGRPIGRSLIIAVVMMMLLAVAPLASSAEQESTSGWIVRSAPGQTAVVADLLAGAASVLFRSSTDSSSR